MYHVRPYAKHITNVAYTYHLYMIVNTGKKQEEKEPNIQVEKGKITRTKEYKYLGNWITESGTVERQLKEITNKSRGMIAEMKWIGDEAKTGIMSTSIQLTLFEKTVIPALLFNLETWINWRKKDWEELERSQIKAMKKILNLQKTTPNWGVMKECGLWPMKEWVAYKKLMLFQQILNTKTERLCKQVIENQKKMKYKNCWYSEIEEDAEKYQIDLDGVTRIKKSEWKKTVKGQIRKHIERQSREQEEKSTKLRHQKLQKYVRQIKVGIKTAGEIITTRLEMWDIGRNLGRERYCLCGRKETTEHILECTKVMEVVKIKAKKEWLQSEERVELIQVTEYIKKYIESREKQ